MKLFPLLKQAFSAWYTERAQIRESTYKYRPGTQFIFHNRHMSRFDGLTVTVTENYPEVGKCKVVFANGYDLLTYHGELS